MNEPASARKDADPSTSQLGQAGPQHGLQHGVQLGQDPTRLLTATGLSMGASSIHYPSSSLEHIPDRATPRATRFLGRGLPSQNLGAGRHS